MMVALKLTKVWERNHHLNFFSFLVVLILVSQRAEDNIIRMLGTENMKEALLERKKRQRGNGPTSLELLVVVYVFGFIWEEIQEIYTLGIRQYLRNMWNFIDFTRNFLYVLVGCLRYLNQNKRYPKYILIYIW